MKAFFLDRMAIVDLSVGTTEYQSLPAKALEQGDLSVLNSCFDDALILACGRLSASRAPAACALTASTKTQSCILTGHIASALKRASLDALILHGVAKASSGLLIHQEKSLLIPLDQNADSFCQRQALHKAVRNFVFEDFESVSLITGLAAFAGQHEALLVLDLGLAQKSAPIAAWLAAHNICALSFVGSKPYASPLDQGISSLASAVPLNQKSLPSLLSFAYGSQVQTNMVIGRAIACHACPAPCGFFLPTKHGFVACTSPWAAADLLAKGASPDRLAEIMSLSERFGLDPSSLSALAKVNDLPETLSQIVPKLCAKAAEPAEAWADCEQKSSLLGVCPFFLRRFPAVAKALEDFCA